MAAGCVCDAVDRVVRGPATVAFCAVRPPGHHAGLRGHTETAVSQGYCIFNNIAIGAVYSRIKYGFERVAIVGTPASCREHWHMLTVACGRL